MRLGLPFPFVEGCRLPGLHIAVETSMDTRATMLQITKHLITLLERMGIIVESELTFRNDMVVVPQTMMMYNIIIYYYMLHVVVRSK